MLKWTDDDMDHATEDLDNQIHSDDNDLTEDQHNDMWRDLQFWSKNTEEQCDMDEASEWEQKHSSDISDMDDDSDIDDDDEE